MDDRGTLGWVESAIDSETVERTGMRFIGGIVCHDEKAAFVEMGTGFIGAGHPHEIAVRLGWRYDINSHGAAGWWYPTTSSDPNPHKREIDGRLYAWTAGMPARPFMHDAYKNLKRDLKTTAKEVFAE
ncbi:MAG: hypothetical protein Q4F79_12580 [Eubacteriales bacterium]|nr:hypothetical protein [Eubacteriales bacterium]